MVVLTVPVKQAMGTLPHCSAPVGQGHVEVSCGVEVLFLLHPVLLLALRPLPLTE